MYKSHKGGKSEGYQGGKRKFPMTNGEKARAAAMHSAICGKCKAECEVPFKPTGKRPILCNSCFKKEAYGGAETTKEFVKKPYGGSNSRDSGLDVDFKIINNKLDAILKALSAHV